MKLDGKVAFVTGGGGGIGGGIVQAFAEKGMRIVVADLDGERAALQARALGNNSLSIAMDVTSLADWAMARETAHHHFGSVDILCNNAGISPAPALLSEMPAETFARVMAINVTAVYYGITTFAPEMCARRSGHIVNTSSLNGLIAYASMGAYSASKFAVTGMSDALRDEMAPFNVGVSVIFPGLTRSRMSEAMAMRAPASARPGIEARMMEPVWLGRAIVKAIENDEPYIISHPAHRPDLERRFNNLLGAFGDPAQPNYHGGSLQMK
jgi:NAD(P)-dependent dehydrogenase (short-subunit alcohol dehydrogenase family)